MEKIRCPYYSNDGICQYKKGLLSNKNNCLCSPLERGDYQTYKSSCWFPKKRELSLRSTCPLVGIFWLENKLASPTFS